MTFGFFGFLVCLAVVLVDVSSALPQTLNPHNNLFWQHIYQRSPSQRPEDNLYEYCALAQEICGFGATFVASYGSEGVFFDVVKYSYCDLVSGALVVRKAS